MIWRSCTTTFRISKYSTLLRFRPDLVRAAAPGNGWSRSWNSLPTTTSSRLTPISWCPLRLQKSFTVREENRPFLLGTRAGQQVSPAAATARMVQGWINAYYWDRLPVGVAAEAALDKLLDGKSYVHASSGFAGFACGRFSLADLQEFSALMSRTLREKQWNEWGSEQIASNYMLANAPGATVLPFPRYACFEPDLEKCDHALLHFIGEHRYNDGIYRRTAAKFIARYKDMRPVPIGTR